MVQPVETVCQMCPNRPLIRNGSLTSQTDFESKLKLFTQWLQSFPIQLIYLSAQALHSFKMNFVKIIIAAICMGNQAFRVQFGRNQYE